MMEIEINAKMPSLSRGGKATGGEASGRAAALAAMFGIGLDERHELTLYEGFRLRVRRGDVVYITGPSGCGKSVLLGAVERAVRERVASGATAEDDPEGPVANLESVDLGGDAAVVDRFAGTLDETLHVVSVAGLADAFLLLRPPSELSDGQRYRYRLARVLAGGARTIVIDEFCSTLDRRTARGVAYRLRKWADRTGATFVVATAHEDLEEDLAPDVMVRKLSGGQVSVRGNGE